MKLPLARLRLPRTLSFRLIMGLIAILLAIFTLGNAVQLHVARLQLDEEREAQIMAQREIFQQDIAAAEAQFHADLRHQLDILATAARGPLLNRISAIPVNNQDSEAKVIGQFATCLEEHDRARAYACLKVRAHRFAIDAMHLVNHLLIKTSIELLFAREGLIAVEILDWDDQLLDGYRLNDQGDLQPLHAPFVASRHVHRLAREVIEEEYLGQVIFYYTHAQIDAMRHRADEAIAAFIAYSDAQFAAARQHLLRARLIEGLLFFVLSLVAISTITLVTIIRPLKQLTQHAEALAAGDFTRQPAIAEHRGDELSLLAATFNLMSENLRQSYAALQQANAELEQKVAERTHELAEKNRELERLSTTDRLTQISNRAKLEDSFAKQLANTKRFNQPLSILLVDVDFFKKINDNYGHAVGDQVLIEVAARLRATVRETDEPGRWGGEEFLVLLPNTDAHGGWELAERIRQAMAGRPFAEAALSVTISLGLTSGHPGDDADRMLERADQALYRAKAEGRNRVCAVEDSV